MTWKAHIDFLTGKLRLVITGISKLDRPTTRGAALQANMRCLDLFPEMVSLPTDQRFEAF